jgi:hypothetical protein
MSTTALKQFIIEHLNDMMNQSIIRRDDDGKLMIRKLVKYKKDGSRFTTDDNVSTDIDPNGDIVVDDLEKWYPDFSPEDYNP